MSNTKYWPCSRLEIDYCVTEMPLTEADVSWTTRYPPSWKCNNPMAGITCRLYADQFDVNYDFCSSCKYRYKEY